MIRKKVKNAVCLNHGYDKLTVSRSVVVGSNFGNGELRAVWRGFRVNWKRSLKEGHRTVGMCLA